MRARSLISKAATILCLAVVGMMPSAAIAADIGQVILKNFQMM
jgi:hypothetical protein